MRPSSRLLLALLVLPALVAGACGPDAERAAPEDGPPAELDLRVALTDPGILDPPRITTDAGLLIAKQLCDTLVAFDRQTGALLPGLAESWTVAPDARKVTFQLRQGIMFHNNRELLAEDYVYSLSRLANPATGSTQHFLLDKVAGYSELRAARAPTLSGAKAPAPHTLEIELSEPFAEFPAVMANVVAGTAVPREEIERSEAEFASLPVCTGPYKAEGPKTGEGLNLIRHPGYAGGSPAFEDGGRGYARSIGFEFLESDSAAYRLVAEGDADVSPVPPSDLAAARGVEGRVASGPNGHLAYIGLPVTRAPFDKVEIRRALGLAVDRREVIAGLLGNSRRAPDGFLPPSAGPGAAGGRCPGLTAETAEPQAAQAALEGAGAALPDPMNVHLNTGGGHEQWLEKVLEQWDEHLGAAAVLKPAEWQPYVDYLAAPGADGPFRLGWVVRFPSPEALYGPLFSSASLDNFTRYNNPDFDAAMNKARSTVDDAARRQAYADAGALLCRDAPIIPMWFGLSHVAFGPGLEAAGPARLDLFGDPILRELRRR